MIFAVLIIYVYGQLEHSELNQKVREQLRQFAREKIYKQAKSFTLTSCFMRNGRDESECINFNNEIFRLLDHVVGSGVEVKNIFRASGSHYKVETLYKALVNHTKIELGDFLNEEISSAIKKYIKDHLNGLFSPELILHLLKLKDQDKFNACLMYVPFSLDDQKYKLFSQIVQIVKAIPNDSDVESFNTVFGMSILPPIKNLKIEDAKALLQLSKALLLVDVETVPSDFMAT